MRCDVAVIGAGISGLACAGRLRAAGLQVSVLEARDRLGGRIRTYRPDDGGPPIELGAQVLHGDRNPLRRRPPSTPNLSPSALSTAQAPARAAPPSRPRAQVLLDGEVHPISLLSQCGQPPWLLDRALTATADSLGDLSVQRWLDGLALTATASRVGREWFRQNWAADQLSASGVARSMAGEVGAVGGGEHPVAEGFDTVPAGLAAGVDVRLGCPVGQLSWQPGRVVLRTGRSPVTAVAVVVTTPPAVVAAGRLRIDGLPPAKQAAAAALAPGDGCCVLATLSAPAPDSAVVFDADGSRGFVSSRAGRPEVLLVAKADAAERLRAQAAVPEAVLALVAAALPWCSGRRLERLVVADWGADPWSGGAFAVPRQGAGWAPGEWARPVADTLFFAGEATMLDRRSPFVHGALDSGVRAAEEILEVLT